VLPHVVLSTGLFVDATVETLNGEAVVVTSVDPPILNANAEITTADLITDNGVVHMLGELWEGFPWLTHVRI